MKYLLAILGFLIISVGILRDEKKTIITTYCNNCNFVQSFESSFGEMLKLRCPNCHKTDSLLYEEKP